MRSTADKCAELHRAVNGVKKMIFDLIDSTPIGCDCDVTRELVKTLEHLDIAQWSIMPWSEWE